MLNKTKVTELLGIDYPIVQGPFGGKFSTIMLTTQVSNLGGLGSFGLNSYSPVEILSINEEIRSATDKPYNLNLWVPLNEEAPNNKVREEVKEALAPYFNRFGLNMPDELAEVPDRFEVKLQAILEARPPVASFIYGAPSHEALLEFRAKGIITMAVATSLEEALYLNETAIDIIICSGTEAGGHRAAFLKSEAGEYASTNDLVDAALKKVNKPIIAASGIRSADHVNKYLTMGAGAVQVGSAFLATNATNISDYHRATLLSDESYETALTPVFSGREARVMKTNFVEEASDLATLKFPYQGKLMAPLVKKAKEMGTHAFEAVWSGVQTSPLIHREVEALFKSLISQDS